ncbi:MAG: FliA/WhiG family RNA polymerase sigma factor [Candidatus Eisenbacteria bacterium]|nr:FliA/WhiG family RNA polymerase sigma factor [Candidatus Eisenbacteria bacterium]
MPESNALMRLQHQIVPKDAPPKERRRAESLKRYAPLVKYVVDRIATGLPKSIEKDDLLNTAIIGLFDALEKFDPSRGTKFETYAIWKIKGAVLDELRSMDWVSRTTRRKARTLERVCCGLDQKLGRAASEIEIAREMGMTLPNLLRMMEEVRGTVVLSLDQSVSVDEDHDLSGLADMIEDEESPDALERIEEEEEKKLLLSSINGLTEQERLVVALYYYEEMTLKEIGETLHISESRVSQIHTKAISRLRGRVRKAMYGDPVLGALR